MNIFVKSMYRFTAIYYFATFATPSTQI